MPKVFKDPVRHFKSSDHHNKPHITLVNGMTAKNLTNYIYNGIKEISDDNIVRSAHQRGYSIIYFTNPKKVIENIYFKNKGEIKEARAKLKFFIAGLAHLCESELNTNNNKELKIALNNLRELAHDFHHDIKAGELKVPLEKILHEITTPKELKRQKIVSPHKSYQLKVRGINRQALFRFNKMDDIESKNLIHYIFPAVDINPRDSEKIRTHFESAKNSIESMQKLIRIYINLRTTTTSGLVRIAEYTESLNEIENFCTSWAKYRKDLSDNSYMKSKSGLHAWASEMDTVVAVLNKRLFQVQSASTPYSNIFKNKINGADKNIFSSPFSPVGSFAHKHIQSPTDNLSPGYLFEDSAEKKLLDTINKVTLNFTEEAKKTIHFNDSPTQFSNENQDEKNSNNFQSTNPRLMSSPTTLTQSMIERMQENSVSLSDDYYSMMSRVHSPSNFSKKQELPRVSNEQAIGDDQFNQLLTNLSLKDDYSLKLDKISNGDKDNNSNSEEFNFKTLDGNEQTDLSSEEINFLVKTNYGHKERTPEKPDPDSRLVSEKERQSVLRKASSKLNYEPLPVQLSSSNKPNPSTTTSSNNAT